MHKNRLLFQHPYDDGLPSESPVVVGLNSLIEEGQLPRVRAIFIRRKNGGYEYFLLCQ